MKLPTFTTLYPDTARPQHGIFVETGLRHLVAIRAATSVVVAPVPWLPSSRPRFGKCGRYAAVAVEEQRHGIRALHSES